MRGALVLLLAVFLLGSLGACGRKGVPEVPEGHTDTLHRHYPSQE
jgi:predicted small lipoprotein YifL